MESLFFKDGPLSTNIQQVDRRHAYIYQRATLIGRLLSSWSEPERAASELGLLCTEVESHFSEEEEVFSRLRRRKAREHQQDHQLIVRRLRRIQRKLAEQDAEQLFAEFKAWDDSFILHVVNFDLDYRFLSERKT